MKKISIIILILVLIVIACKREDKVLIFPLNCDYLNCTDKSQIEDIENKPIKIVIWADSVGCTGCKLQLDTWKYVMQDFDSKFPNKIGYLFYLQFKEREDLEFILGIYEDSEDCYEDELNEVDSFDIRFPIPVIWDPLGNFGRNNSVEGYQCFIIDNHNRILYKGEPPFTPNRQEEYLKIINNYIKTLDDKHN